MKPDSIWLFILCDEGIWPRDGGEQLKMHPKRVLSLCSKWQRAGLYEYGVSSDLGWLTEKGKVKAAELRALEGA